LNLLAKINRSTEKYHSLLKRALTIIIGLLYLQLTDHANVPWAVGIIIFMQGFPETWKLFQGFLQGKKIEKGCSMACGKMIICRYAITYNPLWQLMSLTMMPSITDHMKYIAAIYQWLVYPTQHTVLSCCHYNVRRKSILLKKVHNRAF
jgi:hypothetical protein